MTRQGRPQPAWQRLKRIVTVYKPAGGSEYDHMAVTFFPEENQWLIHQNKREWDLAWFGSKADLVEFLQQTLAALEKFEVDPASWTDVDTGEAGRLEAALNIWGLTGAVSPAAGGESDGNQAVDPRPSLVSS